MTTPNGRIELDRLIQSLSLKIAIYIVFRHCSPSDMDDQAIEQIAWSINELWVLSKGAHDQEKTQKAKQTLHKGLLTIFPDYSPTLAPKDNSLNLIIPAYETLWRVVLFCLIEVSFRSQDATIMEDWHQALQRYIHQISEHGFEEPSSGTIPGSVSVKDIVNEALHLYTPTRRIQRHYHLQNSGGPQTLAADIEALHRDPELFGPDPLTFNPARWHHLGVDACKTFMPFGYKPFVCPAREVFRPKIVAVLVAALKTGIDSQKLKLGYVKDGERRDLGAEEVLETGRGAYESWILVRKEG